jgi:orotidine-5'-phosphate decarboxylase
VAELILALDLPTGSAALRLLDRLPALRWVKLGPILMTAEGPALVREIADRGLRVFLDLKWHDIPHTVAGAVAAAAALGVRMATVHASGGGDMLRAAAAAAAGPLELVGVTLLTSQREPELQEPSSVGDLVERRARLARESGLAGVVCSALELKRLRAVLGPEALLVVPGIRRPGDDPGDQQRIAGPEDAVRWGATHLVVGRPILRAADPGAVLGEFLGALRSGG